MKTKHLSNTTKELVEEVKNQIAITDLSVFSGKLLYQDDSSATYFLLAQVEKNKAKKAKKIVQKSVGLFSWDTVLLVSLWTAFLCLIAMS
jgi:hypothetical protein